MTAEVIDHPRLGELTQIGKGGQGIVYRTANLKTAFAPHLVYKQYKPHTLTEVNIEALSGMPALLTDLLTPDEARQLIAFSAWPCAIVETDGQPTGFVMPAIPDSFYLELQTVKGTERTLAEFQHLLNDSSFMTARGLALSDRQRLLLIREVAAALAFLHRHNICVGDISPRNLLFALTPAAGVYFVDCDTMRVSGTSALPQIETPGWQVPAGEELATVHSDTYKLGLLALRLLLGDQDTAKTTHLPESTPAHLRRLITETLTNSPLRRPLPLAWVAVLDRVIADLPTDSLLFGGRPPLDQLLADPSIAELRSRPASNSSTPSRPVQANPKPATPSPRPSRNPSPPTPEGEVTREQAMAWLAEAQPAPTSPAPQPLEKDETKILITGLIVFGLIVFFLMILILTQTGRLP